MSSKSQKRSRVTYEEKSDYSEDDLYIPPSSPATMTPQRKAMGRPPKMKPTGQTGTPQNAPRGLSGKKQSGNDKEVVRKGGHDMAKKGQLHRKIGNSVVICSQDTIAIIVNPAPESQTFIVHRDLLILHSIYFRNIFAPEPEIKQESIPNSKPLSQATQRRANLLAQAILELEFVEISRLEFAKFISWLNIGTTFFPYESSNPRLDWVRLWSLGQKLISPGFQNAIMNYFCTHLADPTNNPWPSPSLISLIYDLTSKGSKLRKLAAAWLAFKSPLDRPDISKDEYSRWLKLYSERNEVSLDVVMEGQKWQKARPWDVSYRSEFFVEEETVTKAWGKMILQKRTKDEIKKSADRGCSRSMLELSHLNSIGELSKGVVVVDE